MYAVKTPYLYDDKTHEVGGYDVEGVDEASQRDRLTQLVGDGWTQQAVDVGDHPRGCQLPLAGANVELWSGHWLRVRAHTPVHGDASRPTRASDGHLVQ